MESAKTGLRQPVKPLVHYRIDDKLDSSPHVSVLDAPNAGTMMPSNAGWMPPPTSEPRWRQSTLYPDMPCVDENCSTVPEMDSFSLQSGVGTEASRPVSMDQEIMSLEMSNGNEWPHKSVEDNMGAMEQEGPIGQAYTTDDAVPMLDLRYPGAAQEEQTLNMDGSIRRRRMSGSSLTTSGAMSDLPSYDDFSTALSEAPSYGSDYPTTSNRNSLMSSIHVSPVVSPHMTPRNRSEQVRAHSRGRATPSPRASVRSVPYSIDGSKNQRWSTGSYAPAPGRRQSPFIYGGSPELYASQRMSYHGPIPSSFPGHQQPPMSLGGAPQPGFPGGPRAPYLVGAQSVYHRGGMLMPTQPFHTDVYDQPPPLPSQGLFKMLQSNGDPRSLHGHYTDLSDPPDLYSALHEEQIPPPEEDMNPSDPDLTPYEQELRFEGDLYTPRWVRGHGNKREGWCGICKPGRWLVLKNSAFWYDKSFTHGISAATGCPFQEPLETRRMDGNPDVWEGLCSSCNDWVALVSSKKKGTTWFRHAYKCHTHPKVKDGPKRRRDAATSAGARGAVSLPAPVKIKAEARAPTPDASSMHHVPPPSHYPGLLPEPLHLAGTRSPAPSGLGLGNMV
ncbi:Meiotic expression up-regulated protein 26 [Ophiocordyceps camponoti-floridani]|uniref:Meiotic expression up-regulated protein 26 n=1 Tax=Ophiocordyceps camponoti-floridani TaxID=2030778 RepID=A0A8H4Q0U3_9HYPO|nr:Meiotic expression up-regulated protein 26 [Ophiocordyceps camponoti-floridani]